MKRKPRFYANKTFWTWFILISLIFSTAGFVINYRTTDTTKTKDYKNFKFYNLNPGYRTILNNQQYTFSYFPGEVENISANFNLPLNVNKFYFAYNPTDEVDFRSNMAKLAHIMSQRNIRIQEACITEENCPDIPIVSCQDETPIMLFRQENLTKAYEEENCIVLAADNGQDMDMLIERIYFKILGIIS